MEFFVRFTIIMLICYIIIIIGVTCMNFLPLNITPLKALFAYRTPQFKLLIIHANFIGVGVGVLYPHNVTSTPCCVFTINQNCKNSNI